MNYIQLLNNNDKLAKLKEDYLKELYSEEAYEDFKSFSNELKFVYITGFFPNVSLFEGDDFIVPLQKFGLNRSFVFKYFKSFESYKRDIDSVLQNNKPLIEFYTTDVVSNMVYSTLYFYLDAAFKRNISNCFNIDISRLVNKVKRQANFPKYKDDAQHILQLEQDENIKAFFSQYNPKDINIYSVLKKELNFSHKIYFNNLYHFILDIHKRYNEQFDVECASNIKVLLYDLMHVMLLDAESVLNNSYDVVASYKTEREFKIKRVQSLLNI